MVIGGHVECLTRPRRRRFLPEGGGVGAHLGGPVGGFVEALAAIQDFADVRPGEAGQLGIGDRRDNAVTGLAPGEGRGGDANQGRDSGADQKFELHRFDLGFGLSSAWPVRAPKDKSMTDEELIGLARTAASKAYAPYSQFRVGCAVESVEGAVVTGANMENACYRLGLCAEQSAPTAAPHALRLGQVASLAGVRGNCG